MASPVFNIQKIGVTPRTRLSCLSIHHLNSMKPNRAAIDTTRGVTSFGPCVVFPKSRNNNELRGTEDGSAGAEHQNCGTQTTVTKIRGVSGECERHRFLNVASRRVATTTLFIFSEQKTDLEFICHPRLDLMGRLSTSGNASRGAKMSLLSGTTFDDPGKDARDDAEHFGSGELRSLQFVPRDLAFKCRKLVETYHDIYGCAGLPDMLWLSGGRDVIECHSALTRIFTKASKSRGAKRANDTFMLIATVIVALEVLARDYAGWGRRFPAAKREAENLLGDLPPGQRVWLMDWYLYPSLGVRPGFASTLAPPPDGVQAPMWN